jgi:hypothetical protein
VAFFELVNLGSGNRVGDYDTEEDALNDAWAVMLRRGPNAIATIALGFEGDDGKGWLIAEGPELAKRAASAHGVEWVAAQQRSAAPV